MLFKSLLGIENCESENLRIKIAEHGCHRMQTGYMRLRTREVARVGGCKNARYEVHPPGRERFIREEASGIRDIGDEIRTVTIFNFAVIILFLVVGRDTIRSSSSIN